MTHVSIIGTGKMGQAIAAIATKGGHAVELLGKDDPATGDIVVLAAPHSAMQDLLQQRSQSLAGKVVVDISSPVNFETFDSLTVPADSSASDEIAAALPHSHVLMAFNTTFAATLAAGTIGSLTTTVLIAGTTPTRRLSWPTSSLPVGCTPSTQAPGAAPASSKHSASSSSPSQHESSCPGPPASGSSPDRTSPPAASTKTVAKVRCPKGSRHDRGSTPDCPDRGRAGR